MLFVFYNIQVEEIAKKLEHSNVNVSGGSHSATYIQGNKSEHFKGMLGMLKQHRQNLVKIHILR